MKDLAVYKFSRIETALTRLSRAVDALEEAAAGPTTSAGDVPAPEPDAALVRERDSLKAALEDISGRLGGLIGQVEKSAGDEG